MGSKVDAKVVLLGKEYSGKTSLVERYLHHRFNENVPYQNVSCNNVNVFSISPFFVIVIKNGKKVNSSPGCKQYVQKSAANSRQSIRAGLSAVLST